MTTMTIITTMMKSKWAKDIQSPDLIRVVHSCSSSWYSIWCYLTYPLTPLTSFWHLIDLIWHPINTIKHIFWHSLSHYRHYGHYAILSGIFSRIFWHLIWNSIWHLNSTHCWSVTADQDLPVLPVNTVKAVKIQQCLLPPLQSGLRSTATHCYPLASLGHLGCLGVLARRRGNEEEEGNKERPTPLTLSSLS